MVKKILIFIVEDTKVYIIREPAYYFGSQPLTIARSFSYEPDCVIASHILATDV